MVDGVEHAMSVPIYMLFGEDGYIKPADPMTNGASANPPGKGLESAQAFLERRLNHIRRARSAHGGGPHLREGEADD